MHTPSLLHVVFVSLAASWSTVALKEMSDAQGRALFAKRQTGSGSQAFRPESRIGYGDTCAEAFGSDSIECGVYQGRTKCYTPTTGASCCSEGYTCPGNSFCLTRGYCCPEGLSPETCAIERGVTLSAGFKTDAVTPSASASASSAEPTSVEAPSVTVSTTSSTRTLSSTATTLTESTSAEATSDVSTTTPIATTSRVIIPIPTPTTANNNETTSPTVVPVFTGAGHALNSAASGVVAALVGLVGLMGTFF